MRCAQCGTEGNDKFCQNCGARLAPQEEERTQQQVTVQLGGEKGSPPPANGGWWQGGQGAAPPPTAPAQPVQPPVQPVGPPVRPVAPPPEYYAQNVAPPPVPPAGQGGQGGYVPPPEEPVLSGGGEGYTPPIPMPENYKAKKKKSKLPLIIGGAVAAVAAVAVGAWFVFFRGDGPISGPGEPGKNIPEEQTFAHVDIRQIDTSAFPKMTLFAEVTGDDGEPLGALEPKDIAVYEYDEDGKEQPVAVEDVFLVQNSGSVSVSLVIDRSGSMDDGDKMYQAKNAAYQFLQEVDFEGGDAVAVTSFDDKVYVDQGFTDNLFALESAISAIRADGQTALYDAVYSALLSTHAQPGAKCVIAFTDGVENASAYTMEDVIRLSRDTGIPVYVIGVGMECDEATLKKLAEECQGRYHHAGTEGLTEALAEIYGSIYREQQDWLAIVYTSPFGEALTEPRGVYVDLQQTEGYTGTSRDASYTPQAEISEDFAGVYATVDRQKMYEEYIQHMPLILSPVGSYGPDRWRMAQFTAGMPGTLDKAEALSATDLQALNTNPAMRYAYKMSLADFNSCMRDVFGPGAPTITAGDLSWPYESVRNPNAYTYMGGGWYAVYVEAMDSVVLGRPDTADTSRQLSYVTSATVEAGSPTLYHVDTLQYVACRGDYVGGDFVASPGGSLYAVLGKHGAVEVDSDTYNKLMTTSDYDSLQRAIADMSTQYGAMGAECRVTLQTDGRMEDAWFVDVAMQAGGAVMGLTVEEALNQAAPAFREYYESFLNAINGLDSSLMVNCTPDQRARQADRIVVHNKDYTFANKTIRIDLDTVTLTLENNVQTLRFRVRCENDMWKRVQNAPRQDNFSVQDVEMYFDESTQKWIVAFTHYDSTMPVGGNVMYI